MPIVGTRSIHWRIRHAANETPRVPYREKPLLTAILPVFEFDSLRDIDIKKKKKEGGRKERV